MGLATRLATLERAVKGGKVKGKGGMVIGYDPLAQVHPDLRPRMHRDEAGLLWYEPTPGEAAEMQRILDEARALNSDGRPTVATVIPDDASERVRAESEAEWQRQEERRLETELWRPLHKH